MTGLIRSAVLLFVAVIFGIQMIRPARTNPPTDPSRTMASRLDMPSDAAAIVHRACRDCHSNDTVWPWYSNVAPVSWFVIDHVRSGRRHFNYSEWAVYDAEKADEILRHICEDVKEGSMPMGSYTLFHRDARVSDSDVRTLCGWTHSIVAARPAH